MAVGDLMGLIKHEAPELPEGCIWLNTKKPLSLKKLSGHIVILDFWTYCCINCMHLLPILSKIEEKYSKDPVVIIGVHSAKYENENNAGNISEAISRYEITHPVVVDSQKRIWNEYGAGGWPTLVIIGPGGRIAFKASGELSFDQLDQLISGIVEEERKAGRLAKKRIRLQRPNHARRKGISYPGKLSFSKDGSRFALSDSNNNRILIIDSKSGKILEYVGGKAKGFTNGNFKRSRFFRPQGVLWLGDSIYVADTENHAIRAIDLSKRRVSTIAGNGIKGDYIDFGPTYPPLTTSLNSPWDLASDGKEMYIAMAGLHQIWKYSIKERRVSLFAGSGRENITDGTLEYADFAQPSGLWLNGDNIYVADSEVSGIRSISIIDGFVSTIVGKGLFIFGDETGRLSDTLLQHAMGICGKGEALYIADTYNSSIKAVDLKKRMSYNVISGKGKGSMCRIDDPECDTLGLFEPNDVKIFGNKLYIVDTNNHLVRYFDLKEMLLKTLKISE